MKRFLTFFVLFVALTLPVLALSMAIHRDIHFPKNYDPNTAAEIRSVIRDEQFHFVDGLVSYWPPDWGTQLNYAGDADQLSAFLKKVQGIKGMRMRVVLYNGRDDERRRDSDWWLDFSHARPDELTIYVNLNSRNLVLSKVQLPAWEPAE